MLFTQIIVNIVLIQPNSILKEQRGLETRQEFAKLKIQPVKHRKNLEPEDCHNIRWPSQVLTCSALIFSQNA